MSGLNKDEISRIIYDNGLFHGRVCIGVVMDLNHLERFAAIAATAEREACAKVCEQRAADHEEDSRLEDDPDYKERCLVYAKHERRCAKEIRARGSNAA